MDQQELRCPYVVGNKIKLQLKIRHETRNVEAEIIRLFEPFTLSCVMVVRIDCPEFGLDGNNDMVLKVFDRRFAKGAREGEDTKSWTLEIEEKYNEFINETVGSQFVMDLVEGTEDPPREKATELWNPSHDEAYLHWMLGEFYRSEFRVYNTLMDLQGKDIPRLIADVLVPVEGSAMPQPQIPGFSALLLEFIPGFPLFDLRTRAPKEMWQSICDSAIYFINTMGDYGILNEDVQTRSFIVDLDAEEINGFKLTMIDFGLCSFRDEYENEQDWLETKGAEQEEEAIGLVMQTSLEGGFVYEQSFRYRKPASYYESSEEVE